MVRQSEIEAIAEKLYEKAGIKPRGAADPLRLARALLGKDAIKVFRDPALRADAYLARVGRQWRIYLRAGLAPEMARFNLGHEIAEWHIATTPALRERADLDLEQLADRVAAALLTPREFATETCKRIGPRWSQLALDFATTESCAALRYGEVLDEPLVLLTPRKERRRGWPWRWPSAAELRADEPCPGVAKAYLRDDPSRIVALRA